MRDLDQRAKEADARNKIWQYKTRRIVLFFLISGGILTILDKCPLFKRTQTNVIAPASSDSAKQAKALSKQVVLTPKRHHPRTAASGAATDFKPQENTTSAEKHVENAQSPATVLKVMAPIQTAESDNIEFKLMKAEGSSKAQTITITMLLTTSAANWYIMSHVHSIFDPGGNEYLLKSYRIGANTWFPEIDMTTGVPIKCTYTFSGVLPDVKTIKLFKYDYTHKLGEPFYVEFRDVPVEWK